MCILSLSSNDTELSRIISKNPSNPITIKHIRKGNTFGFFTKNGYSPINDNVPLFFDKLNINPRNVITYLTYFKDFQDQTSFKHEINDNYDYMNALRYSSFSCVNNMLSEFYKSMFTYQKQENCDEIHVYSFYVNLVYFKKYEINIINNFNKFFEQVKIEYYKYFNETKENINTKENSKENIYGNYFMIITSTNYQDLIKITYLLFSILSLDYCDFIIDDSIIKKLIKILGEIDAPYYIRNIITTKTIRSENKFSELKQQINFSETQNLKIVFGNNQFNRIKFVNNNVARNSYIIDFGCGEGSYISNLINKANKYICYDVDERELRKAKRSIYNKINDKRTCQDIIEKYKNVVYTSEEDELFEIIKIIESNDVSIIFSEVIEHIEFDEGIRILNKLLDIIITNNERNVKIIMTTPNKNFNHNYLLKEEFRHDDHKFELTQNEFINYVEDNLNKFNEKHNTKLSYKYSGIGDSVDNIYTSQAVVIYKK